MRGKKKIWQVIQYGTKSKPAFIKHQNVMVLEMMA